MAANFNMLRSPPKLTYNGLTVMLSQPSRNDETALLSGTAGYFFNEECLRPETNNFCCDVRLVDDPAPLLEGTKVVMLLGDKALRKYNGDNLTLDEARGNPLIIGDKVFIPSFSAQDAIDPKDYESKFNSALNGSEDEHDEDPELSEILTSKGRGKTARDNYRFWLKADTKKAIRILKNGGKIPKLYEAEPNYHIGISLETVCNKLSNTKGQTLFFDMETDFISYDMRCFAFSFDHEPLDIYVVPTLDTDYKPYYGEEQYKLYKALVLAIQHNVLAAHNGSQFDYFILAWKYHIPLRKVYDTLVSQHRCYLTIEKSLGHCVSLYTYEPYHKNEGAHGYWNREQAQQLYAYCGKDVFTMWLVWKAQNEMADKDPGLRASIEQGNSAIVPYLTTSLLGMRYDDEVRQKWIAENDRLMTKYLAVMQILIGPNVEPLISNQKCARYFHDYMKYPIVSRTKKGNSSLAAQALYKLAIKVNTPVIQFLIKYRETQKATGTLQFNPWIT